MTNEKIEVGDTWLDGNGNKVKIIYNNRKSPNDFSVVGLVDCQGYERIENYTKQGGYSINPNVSDLVSKVKESADESQEIEIDPNFYIEEGFVVGQKAWFWDDGADKVSKETYLGSKREISHNHMSFGQVWKNISQADPRIKHIKPKKTVVDQITELLKRYKDLLVKSEIRSYKVVFDVSMSVDFCLVSAQILMEKPGEINHFIKSYSTDYGFSWQEFER